MTSDILTALKPLFFKIHQIEENTKSKKLEIVADTDVGCKIITVQVKDCLLRDRFGMKGLFYDTTVKKKKKDENKNWVVVEEPIRRYQMSEGDKRFIYEMYVHGHLTGEQISLMSGIPQPYIYRYIKHKKLKPIYGRIPRSDVKKRYTKEDIDEIPVDFTEEFNLDPFPNRAEWKARREELGLKNGENWRNSPLDSNPGPKIQGSGKTAAKKNLAKLERKERRKKERIQKFNSHQNNRYGITKDNPQGTKDPYKQYRESLERKKNGK